MLYVHRSNRVERLVERLAENLGQPLADPLATEIVVVHSQGMQRWLSQRLSQRLGAPAGTNAGICANVEYPFPAGVVQRVLAGCLDEDPEAPDPWEPDRLVWTLLEVLPGLLAHDALDRLATYLEHDKHSFDVDSVGRRRFALARHIADLFDRYAVYRPWMACAWSRGDAAGPDPRTPLPAGFEWQPVLWKALQDRIEWGSQADRFSRARQVLEARRAPLAGLPERIGFFGLSTLPPSYLELLQALSTVHDVHLYLLCPSREYWAEVRDRRQILNHTRDPHEVDAELALEVNPILASFGRLARDFQLHLESDQAPHYVEVGDQPFEDPAAHEGASMLEVVQSDILTLRTRGSRPDDDDRVPARLEDISIRVHSCHGMTRQVEVLREAILRLMEDPNSDLEPRDVVVMTPDVEAYAPVVAAVFSEGQAYAREGVGPGQQWGPVGAPALPFAIADRSLREVNPVASSLMQVLEMVHGRVEASSVLDLLRTDVVRLRFEIGAEDMAQIELWVRDSGIRWGIDRDHRGKHDQPPDHENTWRFGLDRLLLGVAMADEGQRNFAGAVPFDDMEGGAVDLLGRLAEFCESLFDQLRALDHPRPLADWKIALEHVLERMVRTDESRAWQVQQVREVLADLLERSRAAEGDPFAAPLELDAVRSLLSGGFEVGSGSIGHQTGSITFCAMVPMRSIPHRVVCLLGMDDAAFPRGDHSQALDLMGFQRQVGDRSPREEDRFLFLEAILAARAHLIITYTGHDIRTNEPLPPAVPVGQLLDVLDASFVPADGFAHVREQVTVSHPLQAFSPRNFEVGRPLAYDRRMLEGARCLSGERLAAPRFFDGPVVQASAPEADAPGHIELGELIGFWQGPVAWLVARRLGIYLREDEDLVEDREPIELDHLARWKVGASLLDHTIRERVGDWTAAMVGRGALAPGAPGQCAVEDATRRVASLIEDSSARREEVAHEVSIDLRLAEHRLIGTIKLVHGQHLVRVQFGSVHPKHRLAQWIQLLALYAQHPEANWDAAIFGSDKVRELPAWVGTDRAEQAGRQLQQLVARQRQGQRELLPFFDKTSYAYASTLRRRGEAAAFKAAADAWEGGWGPVAGERANAYVAQVYGADCPFRDMLSRDFSELAVEVWEPVLAAQEGKF